MNIKDMPLIPPRELSQELEKKGYRGQEEARKAICLCAYRHVKRLRSIHLQGIPREDIPPKPNAILMGPTGCGKTFLIELLCQILKIPYVLVEMSRFSETGYVGDSVLNILTRLLEVAGGDKEFASCGFVAMDEFDKLASSTSNMRFAGQGTTKDVSGYGVQRELLKMVEGSDIQIYEDYGFSASNGKRSMISTRDITFFAIGAFTGFKNNLEGKSVGFLADNVAGTEDNTIAYKLSQKEADEIGNFQSFGFIPELIARFTRTIPFQPLDASTLANILKIKIAEYQREFKEEGFDLRFDDTVLNLFVNEALEKKTGARGLESTIIKHVENVGFQYFGQGAAGVVTLKGVNKQVVSEVKIRA